MNLGVPRHPPDAIFFEHDRPGLPQPMVEGIKVRKEPVGKWIDTKLGVVADTVGLPGRSFAATLMDAACAPRVVAMISHFLLVGEPLTQVPEGRSRRGSTCGRNVANAMAFDKNADELLVRNVAWRSCHEY